ncbi:MAG: bifunctional tetrahydrofolate synthase/dihydrofolate synthase [Colwellia sp.]|nr:bifunctional tetrahydrofolate synthase/dihydrofolate synthase [Colwellia sp.]
MSKQHKSHSTDFNSLNEWLCYLETIHSSEIDLGLSRISQVAKRLHIDLSFACVITVAGTNGKGSTCAFLENALLGETVSGQTSSAQMQKVAVYSSPHIEHFNERLRINKSDIDSPALISAFKKIELARKEISLSYYEYTTLAAFLVLMAIKPEVIILEVGLGGRLDATNIIDADVAVVTAVDLDHQAFLGNDRETIGFEKAGIMRANQHIIIGDPNAPQSVLSYAKKVNEVIVGSTQNQANLEQVAFEQRTLKIKVRNKDFTTRTKNVADNQGKTTWQWQCTKVSDDGGQTEFFLNDLQSTHIPQDNVATALMVLNQLGVILTSEKVNTLIEQTRVAGRTELFKRHELQKDSIELHCDVMLDVGHNPHAGRYLAQKLVQLKSQHKYRRIIAVVAMLADKDISNTLSALSETVDDWYVGTLAVPRAATLEQMSAIVTSFTNAINCFDNITQAFKIANQKAELTDLILVFGSFYTVAEIRKLLI